MQSWTRILLAFTYIISIKILKGTTASSLISIIQGTKQFNLSEIIPSTLNNGKPRVTKQPGNQIV